MEIILDEYGCNVNKFTSIDNLKMLINKFSGNENIEYTYCKDDADGFILVTNKYVIKLYSKNMYQKILDIYSRIKTYNNIEKIHYYCTIADGVVRDSHNSVSYISDKSRNMQSTINELLIPIFDLSDYRKIKSNITWNGEMFKKLLLDVAAALNELHSHGITHGDTTPDNVGLRSIDNNFVLFDFGDSTISNDPVNRVNDVNRFLNSLLVTFIDFFKNYKFQIENIQKLVNTGTDFHSAIVSSEFR